MIIIDNPSVATSVAIVKTILDKDTSSYELQLQDRYDHDKYIYTVQDSMEDPSRWMFVVDMLDVKHDEYEYVLTNASGHVLSTGLMKIGYEKSKQHVEYTCENEYVFYEG